MIVCSHCRRENRDTSQFCQFCGEALETVDAASQPASQAVPFLAATAAPAAPRSQSWSGDDAPSFPPPPRWGASVAPASGPVGVATLAVQNRIVIRPSSENDGHANSQEPEREYVLDGRDVAVGRAPSCDIVLEGDQLASRRHALLRFKEGVYSIVDLGSSNGTFVNDIEIREATELRDGDHVSIGGHEVIFYASAAGQDASLPGIEMGPAPSRPLAETAPSISAVNLPPIEAGAESGAADADAVGWDPFQEPPPIAMPAHEQEPATPAVPLAGEEEAPDPFLSFVRAERERSSSRHVTPSDLSEPSAPAAEPPERGGATLQLNALRAQLAEIGATLAEKADEEGRRADRLFAVLEDVRERLAALGAQVESASSIGGQDMDALVTIARQAAENPRHLDYLTSLATHAGTIADTLEARHADATALHAEIADLRTRVDEALRQGQNR
jgi:pSer/pThr/pTyr-binding forkhead associated (FHA) protein